MQRASAHGQGRRRLRPTGLLALVAAAACAAAALRLVVPQSSPRQGAFALTAASNRQHRGQNLQRLGASAKGKLEDDIEGFNPATGLELSKAALDLDKAALDSDEADDVQDEVYLEEVAGESVAAQGFSGDEESGNAAAKAAVADAASSNDVEAQLNYEMVARKKAIAEATVLPSSHVFDLVSLVDKYGGAQEIIANFQEAADVGYFRMMNDLREFLFDLIEDHNRTAKQSFVEFEHNSGSKLVLIGTNHLSRQSTEYAREVVREQRPECLVLERRMGDDSLQRFTVPEELFQELTMPKSPEDLLDIDSRIDRARKFQGDKIWLEGMPGWHDIGGEAAYGQEFGAAFEEFALQRKLGSASGPRGGTVVLADSDLRPVYKRALAMGGMQPPTSELGEGPCMPLRDLQMAQSMRAAMRTHSSVVGVVGKEHLAGIARLLLQDENIRKVDEGIKIGEPEWLDGYLDEGRPWERDALGGNSMFMRLAEALDEAPLGSFLAAEAVMELQAQKEESTRRMEADGIKAEPVASVSSRIGADFVSRSLLVTPKTEADLRKWLAGGELEDQEAGDFPYENRLLRRKAPSLPSSGIPVEPPPREDPRKYLEAPKVEKRLAPPKEQLEAPKEEKQLKA
mmetsp:Transcript_50433/g.90696  ORF Transcript_50433/g.90696 Transcript_50433/m.90696 type:complete len:627 (-) Transcript_50433:133-2013(-)